MQAVNRHDGATKTGNADEGGVAARHGRDLAIGEQAGDLGKAQRVGLRTDADRQQVFDRLGVEAEWFGIAAIEGEPQRGGPFADAERRFAHGLPPLSRSADSQSAISAARLNPPPNSRSREGSSRLMSTRACASSRRAASR